MPAPFHLISHHWRALLVAIFLGIFIWACLPAAVRGNLAAGWKKFGHFIGNVNARILLTVLYAVVILPFGLIVRLFSDSMHIKKRPESWFDHPALPNTLDEARRQG